MAEKEQRKTVSVWIGTAENPLEVLKASTGFDGMKAGKSKGKLLLQVAITKSQIDAIESIPEINKMITDTVAMVEQKNIPLNTQLTTPNLPQQTVDQIKANLAVYKPWVKPLFVDEAKGDYTQQTNEQGELLFIATFTQTSLGAQIAKGSDVNRLFRVTHYVKNEATGAFNKRIVDENGNATARSIYSGSSVMIRINTLISKHPTMESYGLTTSRLVGIIHVTEGEKSTGAIVVGYDPLAGMDMETEVEHTPAPAVQAAPAVATAPVQQPYGAPVQPVDGTVPPNPYGAPVQPPVVTPPVQPVVTPAVQPVVQPVVTPAVVQQPGVQPIVTPTPENPYGA